MVSDNPDKHLQTLMQAFNFTRDDLAENIENRMTQPQQNRLRQTYHVNKWLIIGAVAIVLLCGLVFNTTLWGNTESYYKAWYVTACCTGVVLAFMGIVIWSNQRLIHQDITDVVEIVCGKLQKSMPESYAVLGENRKHTVTTPVIEIQDQQFFVTEAQYRAVKHGQPYCIYYADASQTILSIRPIQPIDDEPFMS